MSPAFDIRKDPADFHWPVQSRSLHALGRLLDQQDPNGRRYGLSKLITKQGHIFWLCDHHYQEYQQRERFSPIPLPDSAAPA